MQLLVMSRLRSVYQRDRPFGESGLWRSRRQSPSPGAAGDARRGAGAYRAAR